MVPLKWDRNTLESEKQFNGFAIYIHLYVAYYSYVCITPIINMNILHLFSKKIQARRTHVNIEKGKNY